MSLPRFLLDEHVWGGLVQVGQRIGAESLRNTYRFISEFA
jgi:hypothetical protein